MLRSLAVLAVSVAVVSGLLVGVERKDGGQRAVLASASGQDVPPAHGGAPANGGQAAGPDAKPAAPPQTPSEGWGSPEWVIVYITALYAFIAWLTFVPIKHQADLMEAQARDARASAASAELTMKATLAAFEGQAKEMARQNKNMISRERARVAVTIAPLETLDFYEINVIGIRIENLGPTHALNVQARGDARPLIEGAKRPERHLDNLVYGVGSVCRAISPASDGNLVFFFPEEWLEQLETSKPTITIEASGSVEYEDVFGQEHTTTFSYMMKVSSTSQLPDSRLVRTGPFSQWVKTENPADNCAT